jgi:hypothetical protein
MTAKQKQQLFLGTVVLEVILIGAIGWALFGPVGSPPERPPMVDQTPEETPPALTLPEAATGGCGVYVYVGSSDLPILLTDDLKNLIAILWLQRCWNGPLLRLSCVPCGSSGSTPDTVCELPGFDPTCLGFYNAVLGSSSWVDLTAWTRSRRRRWWRMPIRWRAVRPASGRTCPIT